MNLFLNSFKHGDKFFFVKAFAIGLKWPVLFFINAQVHWTIILNLLTLYMYTGRMIYSNFYEYLRIKQQFLYYLLWLFRVMPVN